MGEFEADYLRGRTVEQLVDQLTDPTGAPVGSHAYEATRLAIAAKLSDRLAAPRRWAVAAAIFAGISAGAAVASAIAAF